MQEIPFIDLYCERTAYGLSNEPVNALSNVAFLLAATWAILAARRARVLDLPFLCAATLIGLIGVGSFMFHSFASSWAEHMDVIPIWSFVAFYVVLAVHYSTGLKLAWLLRPGGIIALILIGWMLWPDSGVLSEAGHTHSNNPPHGHAHDPFNGSLQYIPAVIALFVYTLICWIFRKPQRWWVSLAGAAFVISLALRSIDLAVCTAAPVGTHFLWHLLNALMIAFLLKALILQMCEAREREAVT
ncbi:ceramidase domain-containing protein [Polycladidibacter hongkongensis]|uniref:ceramidase domain-containing protein n=1 Tax=Polycladidibacter hongkongensis TaxID=1647556 RepID=UPI000833A2BA|nr:ceramidase domain-containing protein [Pseudovibrio hongkongensis]